MSETWKMLTWMREVCFGCFGWEPNKIKEIEIETEETACEAVDIPRTEFAKTVRAVLSALRTTGHLQTPGEKDSVILDMDEMIAVSVLETRCAILECMYTRLRAENEKMHAAHKRIASDIRHKQAQSMFKQGGDMSEWTMPEWMREVWNLFGDLCPTGAHNERIISVLTRLRTAGLLQTPGERDNPLCDEIDRLRAENADLLENYKRADRGLRECCDSKERIRAKNKKMQGFIEIVASCAGWQKDEGGNYMESNGVCPNCQDEARKILKALGGDDEKA